MPTEWSPEHRTQLTSPDEIKVITHRADGTRAHPRTIWVVNANDRVYIRSTNGRGAAWYLNAITGQNGQIIADGATFDVTFSAVAGAELNDVDAAYRRKYRRYTSIVDHLQQPGPREATLRITPTP